MLSVSDNKVNGVPSCANRKLLTELLRDEWDFKGYIVSDCIAIQQVHTTHFLMTDIDLWPSSTAYKTILHSRLLKSARAAMVLPAFEFHNDRSKKITRDNKGNQEVHGRTTSRRDARPRKREQLLRQAL